eukprot:TRINITY_DN3298_c1_g1_i2.p1 TRINITY_DN3298_c1_g1~~TRINITY_DN3298_c1_g1_i2.p1  ORF type:complete len:392 (+),score=61.18 TRINITY_DN3298_c1_g1_i2:101-1276(+)
MLSMRDQQHPTGNMEFPTLAPFSLSPTMSLKHLQMLMPTIPLPPGELGSYPNEHIVIPDHPVEMITHPIQLPPPAIKTDCTHYFQILQQPNEKQRKSYRNENRYLLPNPMTVCLAKGQAKSAPEIKQGSVTVKLLYDTGEELEDDKKEILAGIKTRSLDVEKKAQFHLKVVETSERNKFRLQFIVRFFIDKTQYQETITSHCFRVTSNKKSIHVENPKPFALKPIEGDSHSETEIWIRGKCFTDRANTSVKFGGKEAKVIETEDNILVCVAPARDDLTEDTTVQLEVTNHHPELGTLPCAKNLTFTYIVNSDRRRKVKRETRPPVEDLRGHLTPYPPTFPSFPTEIKSEESNPLYCPPSPSSQFNYPRLEDILRSENEVSRLMSYFTSETS